MKRPSALVYGVGDTPPARLLWLAAFQHLGMITVFLVVPLAVCRAAGLSADASRDVLSLTLLALGIGTLLQSLRLGPLGCGYLAPNGPSAIYLGPALVAAQAGGIALVLGMTFFGGAVEAAVSRIWHRLRPYLPIELSGLVVMMIGVSFAALGVRIMLGGRAGGPLGAVEWGVAGCTLLVTVVLNVWARGLAKLICALIGLAAGYALAAAAGVATEYESARIGALPLVDAPGFGHLAWAFDPALMLPFAVAGVAVAFALNLFFRLGVRQKVATTIAAGGEHARAIEDFLNQRGAAWGARQDVVRRAIFGVTQLVETVVEHGQPQGDLALEASFDEFNLDIVVRYPGQALEFPDARPKDAEILANDDGARRLAGYMLRRNADRIQSSIEGGMATVQFHFDH